MNLAHFKVTHTKMNSTVQKIAAEPVGELIVISWLKSLRNV